MNYDKKFVYPPENEKAKNALENMQELDKEYRKEMKLLDNELSEIQKSCKHDYLYVSDCGYSTYFRCQKCGKDLEVG